MSIDPTRQYQRIEQTRYGDSQHYVASGERDGADPADRRRYGGPQHDADGWDPAAVHRLAYEDDHWREYQSLQNDRPPAGGPASGPHSTNGRYPTRDCHRNVTDPDERRIPNGSENSDASAPLA